jgi:hypothetical protein
VKAIRILLVLALVLGSLGLMGAALAQEGSGEQPPEDQVFDVGFPNTGPQQQVGPAAVSPQEVGAAGGELPFTGAQITLFALAGIAAVGAGTALVRRTRAGDETQRR